MSGDPLRILMTADAVGGVWTYALDLCEALQPHQVQFDLIVLGPGPGPDQRRSVKNRKNVRLLQFSGQLEWMDEPWRDVDQAGEFLLNAERATKPDLIHLNGYAHASLPWKAPVMVAGHSCVLSWWRAVLSEDAPDRYDEYRRRVQRGLAAADLVIAPSGTMLRQLDHLYGPFRDSRVVPNGRPNGGRRPGVKEKIVLSAGRLWDEGKNIPALDVAARELDFSVYVAGSGTSPAGKQIMVERLHVLGSLTPAEMDSWMNRAAIFALPSKYEPFGLVALEAAQSGCALVLNDIESLREIWGDAALFVDFDRPREAGQSMQALLDDPARLDEFSNRARERARGFTAEAMAESYLGAYKALRKTHQLACVS